MNLNKLHKNKFDELPYLEKHLKDDIRKSISRLLDFNKDYLKPIFIKKLFIYFDSIIFKHDKDNNILYCSFEKTLFIDFSPLLAMYDLIIFGIIKIDYNGSISIE